MHNADDDNDDNDNDNADDYMCSMDEWEKPVVTKSVSLLYNSVKIHVKIEVL